MLGFVFQHFSLLPRATALENVEMPLLYSDDRSSRRSEALALLHEFGLGDRVDHTPEQLSGGQQQRVAIARALINRPAVLFADEPTGALDSDTGREILTLLQHLNRSNHVTVVLVTHEVEIAAYAGRIISLRDGRVATDEVVTKDVRAGQHSNVCI
jgi:putative ABC transport system ATP-binding protein